MIVRGYCAHSPARLHGGPIHSCGPPLRKGASGDGSTAARVISPVRHYPPGGYAMLTDFQKRKLTALFNLYDVNKDGVVEQADFEHIVQNLAAIQGFQPGSPEYTRLSADHMAVWQNIQQVSGVAGSQRVTPEEFLAGHDRL